MILTSINSQKIPKNEKNLNFMIELNLFKKIHDNFHS